MDHNTALKTYAVEGYVLGDLEESERNGFQEHLAVCHACTREVAIAAAFCTLIRQILAEDAPLGISADQANRFCRRFLRRVFQAEIR